MPPEIAFSMVLSLTVASQEIKSTLGCDHKSPPQKRKIEKNTLVKFTN